MVAMVLAPSGWCEPAYQYTSAADGVQGGSKIDGSLIPSTMLVCCEFKYTAGMPVVWLLILWQW